LHTPPQRRQLRPRQRFLDPRQPVGRPRHRPRRQITGPAGARQPAAGAGPRPVLGAGHQIGTDRVALGYAVCYLVAGEARAGLKLLIDSDDQAKIYLNGQEIYRCGSARALHEDNDTVDDITLQPGRNVLLFKVLNESSEWKGCLRLVDRSGLPAQGIEVRLTP
jgi:hypothetical protein